MTQQSATERPGIGQAVDPIGLWKGREFGEKALVGAHRLASSTEHVAKFAGQNWTYVGPSGPVVRSDESYHIQPHIWMGEILSSRLAASR